MKEVGLDVIKKIQLEILDSIHEFCLANGLKYSLCGGSLLGAVKHQGYVPYDDDIDIMMPRRDYEQFIRTYSSTDNFILNMNEMDSCRELFSKVCRKGTQLVDPILGRSTFSIFVDVCPVDGAPSEKEQYFEAITSKIQLVPKLCAFYKVVPKNKLMWKMKYILKRIISGYRHDVLFLKNDIRSTLMKQDLEESPYAGEIIICRDTDNLIESDVYKNYSMYSFEGKEYMGITDYDRYLSVKYAYLGDYMNLPPLSKPLHEYTAYIQ